MLVKILSYLQDHSRVLKWVFFAFLLGTVGNDFLVERHHAHFWGDKIIGFWALFSLFGCLGMIVFCKGLSHVWLAQPENYYNGKEEDDVE